MSRVLLGAVVLVASFTAAGCDDATLPAGPSLPSAPVLTENFSGTLTINGAITHPFVVITSGTVTATLVTVSPDAEVPVGMSIGTWNQTTQSCAIVIANDLALQGRILFGTAQNSGAFCVRMYDVGRLTAASDYEVVVSHQ